MNILCVAATEFEIAPFLNQRPSVDHLVTGVGAPTSVYHIAKRIQQIDYDLVIQAGIAGSFTRSLELGETVFVDRECFADIGIYEQHHFSSIFETGFLNENEFPFTKGWLENNCKLMDFFPIKKLRGITVNTVTDNDEQISMLKTKYAPQLETMEGASLHYVCLNEEIDFIQLRSVSNYVGEREKSRWKIKEAVAQLNDTLVKIVDRLSVERVVNLKS